MIEIGCLAVSLGLLMGFIGSMFFRRMDTIIDCLNRIEAKLK